MNKLAKKIITLFLIFFALWTYGCDSTTSNGDSNIVFPSEKIDYIQHVQPFLKYNCGYSGCHSSFTKAAGLSVDDYFSVMSYMGLIIHLQPDASTLVQILENKLPHSVFFYRGNITQNQIQGIRKWIEEGALLNPKK